MEKMRVMVVGLASKTANLVAQHIEKAEQMKLVPFTLATLAKEPGMVRIGETEVCEIAPAWHESRLKEISPDIIVEFTPDGSQNIELYCRCEIPFVLRTNGDYESVSQKIKNSNISAVIIRGGTPAVMLKAICFLADRKGEKGKVFLM